MLDAVFDHTRLDAVIGEMGERMDIVPNGTGATNAIAGVKPEWYANCTNYGSSATWYDGPEDGGHDIARGRARPPCGPTCSKCCR